jgi:hypothetical protein
MSLSDDVFLYQHFDAVGHRLQKPKWPNTVWAITILHPAEDLPFQHRHQREQRQEYSKQRANIEQTGRDLNNPAGRAREPRQQPLLRDNENLVN